jgi:hypothetical protein
MSGTPETDAETIYCDAMPNMPWVDADICRKLERERDEARELLASEKITRNHIIKRSVEVEKERDEAREQVKELIYIAGRAIEFAEIDYENDKFGVVSELRNDLEKIKESK